MTSQNNRVYMSDAARLRLACLFDDEMWDSDQQDKEDLRLALGRIKGEMLRC